MALTYGIASPGSGSARSRKAVRGDGGTAGGPDEPAGVRRGCRTARLGDRRPAALLNGTRRPASKAEVDSALGDSRLRLLPGPQRHREVRLRLFGFPPRGGLSRRVSRPPSLGADA